MPRFPKSVWEFRLGLCGTDRFPSVLRIFVVGVSNFRPTINNKTTSVGVFTLRSNTGNVIVTISFGISESFSRFCCCRQELQADDLNFLLDKPSC